MTEKIDYTFKMLYVIAIFMIVDGHIGNFDYLSLNGLLRYQNYHIALFMFASGYFLNLARTNKEFFTPKLSRLILPLYVWNLIYGIISWGLKRWLEFGLGDDFDAYTLFIAPLTDGHQFIYNMASWFLVPLFFVQAISFLILKPFADKKGLCAKNINRLFFIFALLLGCIALHFAPENRGMRNFSLMIWRTLYFMPAFAFGFLYRNELKNYDKLNTPLYLFILLGLISILCSAFPDYNHVPSWLDSVNEPALVIYAISFLAILFWLRISKILTPLIINSKTLQYIADHTFAIMMHHIAGFMLIKSFFSYFKGFNFVAFKNNVWYYYFPANEEYCAWFYIAITLVIALLIDFTSRRFYATIKVLKEKK